MTNYYLVTVKQGETVLKQAKLSELEAFKLLHNAIDSVYSDESSADLTRMFVIAKLKSGNAQALEYNGRIMIFQAA